MCHDSVLAWAALALTPEEIRGRTVIEVGSFDVNGTVRPIVTAHLPRSYLGVDIAEGPGVDRVLHTDELPDAFPGGFDIVISTEMLEHVQDWRSAIQNLVRVVKPGGLIVLSTRSPGFPFHPFPEDHWRYTPAKMQQILGAADLDDVQVWDDPEAPGVFAKARKPQAWADSGDWLTHIEVPHV